MNIKEMNVKQLIEELRKQGYQVEARKRKDGGYLITLINGKKFTGAKGNQYARNVLGVELSQARAEQLSFNVKKYIQGKKKTPTLESEVKKKLRTAQKVWRKNKVHGTLSADKVKKHIKDVGKEGAEKYLERQSRYGEGYAYEENVRYLANYIEDTAQSIDNKEFKDKVLDLATYIRHHMDTFKESWINPIYEYWYEVRENGYSITIVVQALNKTYTKMSE